MDLASDQRQRLLHLAVVEHGNLKIVQVQNLLFKVILQFQLVFLSVVGHRGCPIFKEKKKKHLLLIAISWFCEGWGVFSKS